MGTDRQSSSIADLTAAARAFALRRLGRNRVPCQVVVRLSEQLELEGLAVELLGILEAESGGLAEIQRDIIVVLAKAGHRLTTTQLFAALDVAGLPHGEGPVKATLAQMVRDELLDNKPDAKPPGYGIPGLGWQ